MEFSARVGKLGNRPTGCVVVGVFEGRKLSPSAVELDTTSRGALGDVLNRGDLDGKLDTTLLLHNVAHVASERVLLVGLGDESEFVESSYRTAVCSAVDALRRTGAVDATICLNEVAVNGRDVAWKIEQAVLAVMDGMYRFDKLKSKPPKTKRALKAVRFRVASPSE